MWKERRRKKEKREEIGREKEEEVAEEKEEDVARLRSKWSRRKEK